MSRKGLVLLLLLFTGSIMAQKPDVDKALSSHVFTTAEGKLPYRLLEPETLEEKVSYPLVVFLHGAGERGDDNKKQLVHGVAEFVKESNRKKYPCFLIAPQCPEKSRWVEVDWSLAAHTMPEKPSIQAAQVLALIEQLCKKHPIDRKRIYLTGLSMGGYGTWDLLCRHPELFAAGIPICGGGDEKQAGRLIHMPTWAFHGSEDGAVKPERSRAMIKAIEKAGGKPGYTEYAGVGHDSWTQTYADPKVLAWLFARKKGDGK